jgi:hypothetical protein
MPSPTCYNLRASTTKASALSASRQAVQLALQAADNATQIDFELHRSAYPRARSHDAYWISPRTFKNYILEKPTFAQRSSVGYKASLAAHTARMYAVNAITHRLTLLYGTDIANSYKESTQKYWSLRHLMKYESIARSMAQA